MAFVYNQQRWDQSSTKNKENLGPGYYFKEISNEKIKHAYISPQKTTASSQKFKRSQQIKQHESIQLILRQKQRNCGSRKALRGKIRSPVQFNRTNYRKENSIGKLIDNIQPKNKLQKRYIHTSQSHKESKKRRDQIMRMMLPKPQTPSLCHSNENHENLRIQVPESNIRKSKSKLIQSKKKMSKISHSYVLLTKPQQQKEQMGKNLMISPTNNEDDPLQPRKIKTSCSKIVRTYKKQKNTDSFPYKMNEEGSTGIQDDSQNSTEYIDDATPGPGSYNLATSLNTSKNISVGKFGVTVKRFEEPKQTVQGYIQLREPYFKKTSKAPQQMVAFGNSIRQQFEKQLPQGQIKFLQDKNSIQNKSCKNLLKSYYSPGFFLSKEDRFVQAKAKDYFGPEFYVQEKDEEKQIQLIKPQAVFLSKVKRIYRPHIQTIQADFNGQDFNTIQRKIKQKLKQNIDIDRKPAGFLKDQPRFVEKPIIDQQPVRPLHETLKKKKRQSQNPKGYTFRKAPYQNKFLNNTENPSFTKYNSSISWIKSSFNRKFQHLEA